MSIYGREIEPKWRVIVTNSEQPSGVAPTCPFQERRSELHDRFPEDSERHLLRNAGFDLTGVYDCCPQPHLECWSEINAKVVLVALNNCEVELCDG